MRSEGETGQETNLMISVAGGEPPQRVDYDRRRRLNSQYVKFASVTERYYQGFNSGGMAISWRYCSHHASAAISDCGGCGVRSRTAFGGSPNFSGFLATILLAVPPAALAEDILCKCLRALVACSQPRLVSPPFCKQLNTRQWHGNCTHRAGVRPSPEPSPVC
jgi:hypothetical protein